MAKYVYGKPQTTRVNCDGEYSEEWIEIRRVKWDDAQRIGNMTKDEQKNLLIQFIVDWSIADEGGNKVPINVDTLAELPIEIVLKATQHFNDLFLALDKSAKPKSDK